jgi:carotenoid cleavage dioxygenase-like enzyme
MSENYAIFVEQPHILNVGRYIANGLVRNEPYRIWLEWHPEYPNRFYVINKKTGKVLNTEFIASDVFYFIHIINCYEDEENEEIILDISTYDDPAILDNQFIKKLRTECSFYDEDCQASIRRFVIPLNVDTGTPEGKNLTINGYATRQDKTVIIHGDIIAPKGMEMLTLNQFHIGRPYAFAYGTSLTARCQFAKSIVKVNFRTKELLTWNAGENMIFGEVRFVPRISMKQFALNYPTIHDIKKGKTGSIIKEMNNNQGLVFDEAEDDGFLIVPSMDLRESYPDFIFFLNAKTMEEVGRVTFNMRIPPAFHGHFVPD